MFRRIDDFAQEWPVERASTIKLFQLLTDESLSQKGAPHGRSLGFLAWHITGTFREMMAHTGLDISGPELSDPVPDSAAAIVRQYEQASAAVLDQVTTEWTDDSLEDDVQAYGRTFRRGQMLDMLIRHEAHHRGQMTVLMRMAGLPVAGPYGPSQEEWRGYGMEPHP